MTDIVERLREWALTGICVEAADEIERLRAERDEAITRGNDWCDQAQKARAELEAALASASRWPEACGDATVDLMVERDAAIRECDAARAEAERLGAEVAARKAAARLEGFVEGGKEALANALHPEFGSIYAEDGEATAAHKAGRREGIKKALAAARSVVSPCDDMQRHVAADEIAAAIGALLEDGI